MDKFEIHKEDESIASSDCFQGMGEKEVRVGDLGSELWPTSMWHISLTRCPVLCWAMSPKGVM